MFRLIIIFLILNIYNPATSSIKSKIISQMKKTTNLNFNFIQTINEKEENGNCTIKYPKKIYCEYNNLNKKIIVSNGKSLVIKNINSGSYYIYPLKKTPLEFILNKNYLISKIKTLEPREIDNKYINFTIFEKENEINIFFNKKTLNLIGWQTEDIYQNMTVMFISSIKINQKVDEKIFLLPKNE
ncbi:outer membrane lipoprotein carrier protein LolA [Pelagibacterales bacterium SAG-MED20]|nr:outer membrane lipoprotein carrier protein LolA [Pelagibacterales bacterium SAG-MED20]